MSEQRKPEATGQVDAPGSSDSWIEALLDRTSDPAFEWTPEGRWARVNRPLEALAGVSAEALIGTAIADRFVPEDRNAIDLLVEKVISNRVRQGRCRGTWRSHDGAEIRLDLCLRRAVSDSEGCALLGTLFFVAPTETPLPLIPADRNLVESVLDAVASIVVVLDRQGRIVLFNRAAERATGYEARDVLGQEFFFLVPEGEREEVRVSFKERVALGGSGQSTNRWIHRDGGSVWFEWSTVARMDDAGNVVHIISTGIDVTETQRVSDELARSRQRYELAIDAQNDGVFDIDYLAQTGYYSDRWYTMLGYEPGEIAPSLRLGPELVLDEDRRLLLRTIDEALSEREPFECEVRMRTKDGGYRWILTRGQGVFDKFGQLVRLIGSHTDIQRRKSAEEALRESQFRLQEATEVAGLATWHVFAVDGFWWSPKMFEFHGLNPWMEPPDWDGYLALIHPEDRHAVGEAFQRLFEDGHAFSGRYRIVRPNGEVRILIGSAKLLPIDDTFGQTCVGTCLDITDQARAELELRETRDLLIQSQRIAKMGSLVIDVVARTVEWSEQARQLLGAWADVKPFPWDRVVSAAAPEFRSRLESMFARAVADGRDIDTEIGLVREDGETLYFHVLAKPVVGDGGEVQRFIGCIQDVTDSHEAARRIATQRTFLRRVIDASPGLIFVKDREGRFVLANQAVASVYGCQVDQLIGKRDADFSNHPDEVEQFEAADRMVFLANNERIAFEEVITDHRGQSKWLHTVKQPIISPETGESQILGVCTDITERVLFQHQLEAAREAALESSRLKSEFIANLSHEIRTPMNGLLGMTDLLGDTSLSGEQTELLRTIRSCGENLLSLLNDLLDFSKVEAGKMTVEVTKVDVVEVVEDVLSLFSATAYDKGLDLQIDVDWTKPCFIRTDAGRLRQVVSNLVANAVKFTEKGFVRLCVRELPGAGLKIEVIDSGIGIPADRLGAIFESFVQGDGSTTRRFGGTGLGLTISRQLTELLGGSLRVTSQLGAGSTFFVEFPAGTVLVSGSKRPLESVRVQLAGACGDLRGMLTALGASLTDHPPQLGIGGPVQDGIPWIAVLHRGELRPAGAGATLFRPVTRRAVVDAVSRFLDHAHPRVEPLRAIDPVLVVEDDAVSRRVTLEFLRQSGVPTMEAANGAEALQKIQELPFSMILMDVELPKVNGIEVTRQIRLREAGKPRTVPIIGLSGHRGDENRELGLSAGMNDYLVKPIHREELHGLLTKWLPESVVETDQIDLSYLREIAGDDEEFQRDVIVAYMEALPGLISELQDADRQRDLDRIRRAAHTLKGSSRSIGANPFASLCEAAEEAAKVGEPSEAVAAVLRSSKALLAQCERLVR